MTLDTTKQNTAIADFLDANGWDGAKLTPLAGDASTRSYMRAQRGSEHAVLMIAPPAAEAPPCPPGASDEERRSLGYNACARLAGPNLSAFVAIAKALKDAGLSAPKIFAADISSGFALIEDLGDDLFARVAGQVDEEQLYSASVDVLIALRQSPPEIPTSSDYSMLSYDRLALQTEANLLMEWYWPLRKDHSPAADMVAEFVGIFTAMTSALSKPSVMALRDYHAENLLWVPNRTAVQKVGLIDFQDGLIGSPAYDLVSLLEDARRDVSPDLADKMKKRYTASLSNGDPYDHAQFEIDYAVLAAQRNAKILGIFARLAKRDHKPRYLDLLPRVEAHFRRDLARPECAPLNAFFKKHLPGIAP